MLFRTAWARQALPLRRQAFTPLARRSVTTDAASAHAENIPQVGSDQLELKWLRHIYLHCIGG